MTTEVKRRGRPPKIREAEETAVEVETVDADALDDEVRPIKAAGPPCRRCARPMDRSTRLLRRYGLVALRCNACRDVGIENDSEDQWWDVGTAAIGNPPPIVRRAMTLYAERHNASPPTPLERDAGYEAAMSDWNDERWDVFEF
jgi:hypothetical protein